jgi:hypothetical protein
MDVLQDQLKNKDKEIADLKKQLKNE